MRTVIRIVTILSVLTLIAGSILIGGYWISREAGEMSYERKELKRFSSFYELKLYIDTMTSRSKVIYGTMGYGGIRTFEVATTMTSSKAAVPYSETNVQVEGVDEPDIIKTDGAYMYIVKDNEVYIIRAYPPEDAEIVSRISLNESIKGIFIKDDKLVVFTSQLSDFYIMERGSIAAKIVPPGGQRMNNVTIYIYDLSEVERPNVTMRYSIDGDYIGARMIEDYVYLISQYRIMQDENITLPKISVDEYKRGFDPTRIVYADIVDMGYNLIVVTAIDISDENIDYEGFLFPIASTIYVSRNNIYVTCPDWEYYRRETVEMTRIFRIAIEGAGVKVEAQGVVPGYVLNQFSMDEYDGHFRVATTLHKFGESLDGIVTNNIYVLNMSMDIVGKLEGLAVGEMIYSVRFMGRTGYVVTFKKVDPLFIIDLSDPTNLVLKGKLKIPGYSSYLHPVSNDYILGIGKEAVPAEEGDFAWYQGIKISLFWVGDLDNPREIDSLIIGDRGSETPVLYDHRAFIYYSEKGLAILPILIAKVDPSMYGGNPPPYVHGEPVWQGLIIVNVTKEGLHVVGDITHIPNGKIEKGNIQYEYSIIRSAFIGDYLYTLSMKYLMIHSLKDFNTVNIVIFE